jgi:hypothetical protein
MERRFADLPGSDGTSKLSDTDEYESDRCDHSAEQERERDVRVEDLPPSQVNKSSAFLTVR